MASSWGSFAAVGVMIALYGLIAAACLRRAYADKAEDWALFNGVVLTDETEPVVTRYLDNRYWFRRVGAVSGLVIAPSVTAAFGIDLQVTGVAWVLLGYLVGVVVAELTLARVPGDGGRVASLVTRRVRAYAPGLLLIVQIVLPAVAVGLSVVTALSTESATVFGLFVTGTGASGSQRTGALWAGPIAVAITVVVFAGQRYLVRRPQPIGSREVVEVDDAMRMSAVRLIGATGATVAALLVSGQSVYLGNELSPGQLLGSTLVALGALVGPLVAAACWFGRLPRGYRLRPPSGLPIAAPGEAAR